ncbi:hypothetical protein [Knoellia aerolata]|uniref:Uncharacterized protein n=1 Tax=Knoellia aerolata DSM 18566 TaxID=1385519 RepID=A0A0A0JY48_9MICO|nr:hypothetical protein [Knoellia aerolata]KGN40476.1 hypothetical protein N801_13530 [Knoellia aerolata DSM 18566]
MSDHRPGAATSPPPPPPALVDLRQAHEAVVRQLRIGRLAALGTMVGFALLLGFAVTAVSPGPRGLAAGLLACVGFLALLAGLIAVSVRKDARLGGPAGPGPSSLGQVVTSAPGQQVWTALSAGLSAQGFSPPRATDPNTVVATRSLSTASWGETMTVRVEPHTGGRGLVTVWSRPAYPLQWLDYGRNRRHANAVLAAVPDVHEEVHEPHRDSQT